MKKVLSVLLTIVMLLSGTPLSAFATETSPAVVPEENYLINTNQYMTRLRTNINGEAEFELGFKVRFDGEEQDRFTPAMGEKLLTHGRIKINNGTEWSFSDAGMKFATAKSKSSFLTTKKDFIKEFYESDTLSITLTTPEGYLIKAENISNTMDAVEREAFKNSLGGGNDKDPIPDENEYTIDPKYTFLKDQYGTLVLRIDLKEFTSGSDPAKKEYLENTSITINDIDLGNMKTLGFTITNYYGFELADLTKIKSVIMDDELRVVLSHSGKKTSFTITNQLTAQQRQEILGTTPTPEPTMEPTPEPTPEPTLEPTPEPTPSDNEYTIDPGYTFLKNQYGDLLFRIDIKEFTSGSDPAKKEYLENTSISINGNDFGNMKSLGFYITNYFGFELKELAKIAPVIKDESLSVVLTHGNKTTSFVIVNQLTKEERDSIVGVTPQPETDPDQIGNCSAALVKSNDPSQDSMSGTTMKPDAQMITDDQGNVTMILHFAPAVIMDILAYATDLKLNDGTTEFIMKEDNTAVCIAKLPAFTENEKIFQGHIYSSVMDADVALKITKPAEMKSLKTALSEKVNEIQTLLDSEQFYENTKQPVLQKMEAAKNPEDTIAAYTDLIKAVAGLRKIAADPFTGADLFHVEAIDTSIVGSKALEKYVKVEIVDGKKILTAHYNSYLDWDGMIYLESVKVLDTEGREIPSTYTLDEHKNGVLTFEMPYIPASGLFDLEYVNGNDKKTISSELQMDYSTITKGLFKKILEDAIEEYTTFTDSDWNTKLDIAERKDDFTPASWENYETVLARCKADLQSGAVTQEQLDQDVVDLKAARKNLLYKIKAGQGSTANTGIRGLNNPPAPYYSDPDAEYPEYVGWGGSKIVYGNNGDVYRVLNNGQKNTGKTAENTGKILLMSDELRITQPYTSNTDDVNVRWNTSIMRKYMNDTVYNTMFSPVEKEAILLSKIETFDYTDGYMGPPALVPDSGIITEDYLFAPGMNMLSNPEYGFASKDSRVVPTEYSLRETFQDMFGELVTMGVSPKGRIQGTYSLSSAKMNAPVCMYLDSSNILMTLDAETAIPQELTPVKTLDSNLWKLVLKDKNLKLDSTYDGSVNGNTVSVPVNNFDGQLMAVIIEGNDFSTGKITSYGIVDPSGFTVQNLDVNKEKLYIMAVKDAEGKTVYASEPALVNISKSILPGTTPEPEIKEGTGTVDITMLKESTDQNSMCNPMFAAKADVEVKDNTATIKIYVVNPVPGFPAEGKDGTVKNFVVNYEGQEYVAGSDITTKPEMTAKETNVLFKLTKGEKYSAQILTLTLPKEALNEKALDVTTYVNVVMNTDVAFRMLLSNLDLKAFEAKDQWIQEENGNWWYSHKDGSYTKNDWEEINGKWYYFNESGWMLTGWIDNNGTWYYTDNSGVLQTGWHVLGGRWYYFDRSGKMVTGWAEVGGRWYYFETSGAMATGWAVLGGKWYYFDASGAMATEWKEVAGRWYYFEASGAMTTGWAELGGRWYYFQASGAMATDWKEIAGKWYYFQASGAMTTGWAVLGGKWYYFTESGAMAVNQWVGNSYVGASGAWEA